jgi:hypothetical protein
MGARIYAAVSRLLEDEAKQGVSILLADFRKFNPRTLLRKDVQNSAFGENYGQVFCGAKPELNFVPRFEAVKTSQKKAATAQGFGGTTETLFADEVFHRHVDVMPWILPCVRFIQFLSSA